MALTTILLHKRHAVPVLPLTGGYSPCSETSPDMALTRHLPPTWYRVANWEQEQDAPRWPIWDVLLGLWTSEDLMVAYRDTVLTTLARRKRGCIKVLYAYATANRTPTAMVTKIHEVQPKVIILDSPNHHGLLDGEQPSWPRGQGGGLGELGSRHGRSSHEAVVKAAPTQSQRGRSRRQV